MRVRDALGPLFTDTDFTTGPFAKMYSNLGQPGLSPALLTMVMILQFRHNLSDQDAAQAVCDRISWKYALGLDLDYCGFDPSVLTEFRTRLIDNGRVDAMLDVMLDRLKAAGLVNSRWSTKDRLNSRHRCGAPVEPDRDRRGDPAGSLGSDRPDQPILDRASAGGRLGRTLRPQGRNLSAT